MLFTQTQANSEIRFADALLMSSSPVNCLLALLSSILVPWRSLQEIYRGDAAILRTNVGGAIQDHKRALGKFIHSDLRYLFSHLLRSSQEKLLILMSHDYLKNLEGPKYPKIRNRSSKILPLCYTQVNITLPPPLFLMTWLFNFKAGTDSVSRYCVDLALWIH